MDETKNGQPIPTQAEIATRLAARKADDFFGAETGDYLERLDFALAQPYLKPEATAEAWAAAQLPLTREHLIETITNYLDFAWEKAIDKRGLSAGRSIAHFTAWTWMAGDFALSAELDDEENYEFYGKDLLVKVCRFYGLDPERWDDHVRENS